MVDVPAVVDEVVDALAASVTAVIPLLASRIPPVPAAQLGRTAVPPGSFPSRPRYLSEPLLAERLLGALELTIPSLVLDGAPDLPAYLKDPGAPSRRRIATVTRSGDSEVMASVGHLASFQPGSSDLTVALCQRLSAHPLIVPLLESVPEKVPDGAAAEETFAAAHGAGHLALGVAVGWAVTGQGRAIRGPALNSVAAAVGLGLSAARAMLAEVPLPEAYAVALLAKVRAEYLLPRTAHGKVPVAGHRFALTEGDFPADGDFSGNGLVAVVPGGAVIRTGMADGSVEVLARVYGEEPRQPRMEWWDEVVEVSWHANAGQASIVGAGDPEVAQPPGTAARRTAFRDQLRRVTPPWPGDYRLRVCATGRDDADDEERYELHVWQAPPAPEIVHKRADRLGHRLRGEPEPAPQPKPWKKYREIRATVLDIHGTITVVTGSSPAEVVRAFGADPARPGSLSELEAEEIRSPALESSIAVLPVTADGGDPAAIVIESNGFRGANRGVLAQASANGRAASFHQNAKGLTNLGFAEGGRVLESYEPFGPPGDDAGPEVQAAVDGLNFADVRDHGEKCLFAVERFTGRGITPADLERIRSADVGYRVQG